jgi:hypothetical protein
MDSAPENKTKNTFLSRESKENRQDTRSMVDNLSISSYRTQLSVKRRGPDAIVERNG